MADIGFTNVEVLSAANIKVLAINNTRVSRGKGYGLMTPIATFEVAVSDVLNALNVQPVKRGRWFHINDEGIVYCSECNNEAYWDTDYGQQLFDYCPCCGARMDGGTNV